MRVYEPWWFLNRLYKDLEQLYGLQDRTREEESTVATSTWVPAVDLKEEENHFVIYADLPGVEPNDIEITLEQGVLTIKGERRVETMEEKKSYKRIERVRGTFYRRFSLPERVDADKISATSKQGVLEIFVPKREVTQTRKISVIT